jgi:glycogenin
MSPYAFVTLLTSDHYLPGTLALAAALKDVHDSLDDIDLVCLVTPETVDVKSIKLLRRAFDHVIGVELIEQLSSKDLELLGLYLSRSYLTHIPHASYRSS